jgi:signal peptidase I
VLIKRLIAVENETVELVGGVLYINDELVEESYLSQLYNNPLNSENTMSKVTVREGHVFFMGDNRNVSIDSRNKYGDVDVSCIVGVVPNWSISCKSVITAVNTFFDFTIKF